LDHTEQFHEVKEEQWETNRRRMSSFPPSDGDESMMILERIHYLSTLEMDEQSRAATPVSETIGPLKLLKKSLCLPSSASSPSPPHSIKWKSATNIHRDSSIDSIIAKSPKSPQKSLLAPSVPLNTRRRSSPCVPDLNELRRQEAAKSKKNNVVVFPKRKIEDVPGIFIPSSAGKKDMGGSGSGGGGDDLGRRISQFLGVKEAEGRQQRRHSLSDPALLKQFSSATSGGSASIVSSPKQPSRPNWLPNLTPRSPYASNKAVLPFPR
jgi:hypothetical protein